MNAYSVNVQLLNDDCLIALKTLADNSVDSVVTDPPYELGFMGKSWDNTGIANNVEMWKECLRVLKPGGHLLAFSGTRTYHRMASAIEDAGFEVRDMIEWVYGSGFPKSLNIGKAVDKLQGNEREVVGKEIRSEGRQFAEGQSGFAKGEITLTKGTSEWEGWGTALKPAHEPICMARKPLSENTVAENCLKWGTGGINIDESRVECDWQKERGDTWLNSGTNKQDYVGRDAQTPKEHFNTCADRVSNLGRFPANLIHDNSEEVRECFPDAKGASSQNNYSNVKIYRGQSLQESETKLEGHRDWYNDNGNASRFFKSIIYQAKASKSERNSGLEEMPDKPAFDYGSIKKSVGRHGENTPRKNHHPTVKPINLMRYLITLVTPKKGIVLDPFLGSGTTALACIDCKNDFIGIEKNKEYFEIAKERIERRNNEFRKNAS